MATRRVPTPVPCEICGKMIGRKADLPRHMKLHATNKDDLMFACTFPGCRYKTLQHSNLTTHMNKHTRQRPHKCPTEGCSFSSADPASLTRHRKEIHGYVPRRKSAGQFPVRQRRNTRQGQRFSPYPNASNGFPGGSSDSASPVEPSLAAYYTPRTEFHQLPNLNPESAPPMYCCAQNGLQNSAPACHMDVKPQYWNVDNPYSIPNTKEGQSSLAFGLMAQETMLMNQSSMPTTEVGNFHAIDPPARPVSEATSGNSAFERLLANLDGLLPDTSNHLSDPFIAYPYLAQAGSEASLPPAVNAFDYTIDKTHLASIPPPTGAHAHSLGDVPAPPVPSYVGYQIATTPSLQSDVYGGTVADASYESYVPGGISLDEWFLQTYPFPATDMNSYPQVINGTYPSTGSEIF